MKRYLVTFEAFGVLKFCRVQAANEAEAREKALAHWNVKVTAKETR